MPILSIIIPIYNVEPYLDECLKSLCEQSFQDVEFICINDGSTDNSLNILKEWREKDSRFIIIDQPNKGVSAARNEGIRQAKGKYIGFVDADDWVCNSIYSFSIPIIIAKDLDVYIFSFKTYPHNYNETTGFITNQVVNYQELLASNKNIQSKNSLCFNWRFIFRKSLLIENDLWFNEDIAIGEDMIYNIDAICHASRIMVTDDILYIHRLDNPNSAMTMKYKPKLKDSLYKMYEIKKKQIHQYNIDNYTPYSYDLARYTILVYLPLLIANMYNTPHEYNPGKELKQILSDKLCKDAFKIIGYKNIYSSWKEYAFYLALKLKCINLLLRYYDKHYK